MEGGAEGVPLLGHAPPEGAVRALGAEGRFNGRGLAAVGPRLRDGAAGGRALRHRRPPRQGQGRLSRRLSIRTTRGLFVAYRQSPCWPAQPADAADQGQGCAARGGTPGPLPRGPQSGGGGRRGGRGGCVSRGGPGSARGGARTAQVLPACAPAPAGRGGGRRRRR